MKGLSDLRKKLKTQTGQENSGSSAGSEALTVVDKNAHKLEEEYGLFILHDLAHGIANALDIVAVHGLGGHWRKTWTDSQTEKNWLQDFLPYQLKSQGLDSRIMSYGYNSGGILSKAVSDIDDVARELLYRLHGQRRSTEERERPILFVAHSLGGVVVKKTMIVAHERSTIYRKMLDKVKGFIFLAVPHRGSDLAFWYTWVTELSKFAQVGFAGNANFVAALKSNSKTFADISAQSIERLQSPTIKIRTFYESDRIGNQLIVDRVSAVLDSWNERATQISSTNHRTICKFPAKDAQTYLPIFNAISEIAEEELAQPDTVLTENLADTSEQGRLSITNFHSRKAGDVGLFEYGPHIADRWQVLFADRTPTGNKITTHKFSEPYLEPPRVLISISHLDVLSGQPLRARASVSEVTPTSFRPVLESWAGTIVYGISGSWLEIAPGDSDIQTGRCNTYGLVKDTNFERHTRLIREVKFYQPYQEVPEVICYLVHIDSSERRNHRMHVEPLNITPSGFELCFNTWADSIIFELEAEWVAFRKDRHDIYTFPETLVQHPGKSIPFSFPEKKFRHRPACFVALSYLDIGSGQVVRVKVSVKEVTENFAIIDAGTWADSSFWLIGFTGLAIL